MPRTNRVFGQCSGKAGTWVNSNWASGWKIAIPLAILMILSLGATLWGLEKVYKNRTAQANMTRTNATVIQKSSSTHNTHNITILAYKPLLPVKTVALSRDLAIKRWKRTSRRSRLIFKPRKIIRTKASQDLVLKYTEGTTGTALFDYCLFWDCYSKDLMAWRVKQAVYYLCVGPMCREWKMVLTNTGTEDWGYIPPVENAKNMIERFHLFKMIANPSVHRYATTCNPGGLTIIDPKLTDSGTYSIGMKESGRDRIGNILIQVSPRAQAPVNISKEKGATESPSKSSDVITYVDLTNFTANDQLEIETGFNGDQNLWLQQLRYTARTQNLSSCLACAAARPRLTTAPFPINPVNDIVGFECMMRLFSPQPGVIINCKTLSILFPAVSPTKPPMGVLSYPGNYACLSGNGMNRRGMLGELPSSYCHNTIKVGKTVPDCTGCSNLTNELFNNQTTALADVWWICGPKLKLRPILPKEWSGTCAMIRLLLPITMVTLTSRDLDRIAEASSTIPKKERQMFKRSIKEMSAGFGTWDPDAPLGNMGTSVYLDAIGVPRGVPDEFKARNQVGAGFESIFLWITTNKNVDWINYIYYNQQRFLNHTRDAIKGLAEQLHATSLTAWQNRMALDMLLAEKGGVCKMFGETCCTFIPENTAPDGSITRALAGLTSLSNELAENSGIDTDPLTSWLDSVFGKYKAMFLSAAISLAVFTALLSCCGCCCIPCLRSLSIRLIETAIEKKDALHGQQMSLLGPCSVPDWACIEP